MNLMVGVRLGSGGTRQNRSVMVGVKDERPYTLQFAWRQAALRIYNNNLRMGSERAYEVHILSFSGDKRPLGTWHVQFLRGGSLYDMYIVNVDREDG